MTQHFTTPLPERHDLIVTGPAAAIRTMRNAELGLWSSLRKEGAELLEYELLSELSEETLGQLRQDHPPLTFEAAIRLSSPEAQLHPRCPGEDASGARPHQRGAVRR